MKATVAGRTLFALALILVCCGVFAQTLPAVSVCNNCYSDASFEHRAEQASLASRPLFEGLDYVYVVNLSSEEVRYFQVDRWMEYALAPYSQGNKLSYNYGSARADAVEIAGEPSVLAAIGQAIDATKDFSNQVAQGISADELGLPFDSAIALIGPDSSPAGLNRNALKNMLRQHLSGILQTLRISMTDLAQRALSTLISDSSVNWLSNVTVEFPDGTLVEIEIVNILDSLYGNVGFHFEVRVETIAGPGLPAVPLNADQFAGFQYSGSGVTVAELINLALRYNIPVNHSGSGGSGEMECEVDGDKIRCTVRYSGY